MPNKTGPVKIYYQKWWKGGCTINRGSGKTLKGVGRQTLKINTSDHPPPPSPGKKCLPPPGKYYLPSFPLQNLPSSPWKHFPPLEKSPSPTWKCPSPSPPSGNIPPSPGFPAMLVSGSRETYQYAQNWRVYASVYLWG